MTDLLDKKSEIFNELDHRLSVVKRWQLVHTIQTQSVAEHVFNVQRIAVRLATLVFEIDTPLELYDIALMAHHHDNEEALTGDIPTPAKGAFVVEEFEDRHGYLFYKHECRYMYTATSKMIVKLADLLEAYHFLAMELKLGNSYVTAHHQEIYHKIKEFVEAYCPPKWDEILDIIQSFDYEKSRAYT